MNKDFKCRKCKCEPEELIAYLEFNKQMDDQKWYCHSCFDKFIDKHKQKETDEIINNTNTFVDHVQSTSDNTELHLPLR